MKRYRVWEANRKIFLWPENWLDPEFRDDKTHLFDALESTLLAGDVTDDLAEEALFAYLRGLEPLARLDVRVGSPGERHRPGRRTPCTSSRGPSPRRTRTSTAPTSTGCGRRGCR